MKKENLNTTENKKTQEEEVMGYEYDDDIELDCVVMAGEGAVMRYDENGDVATIYDEEKLNSAIEEEKVLNSRECKITNEDVAESILSVDKNEEAVLKYFPHAEEMDNIGKIKLLIEAKHIKLDIDWPTGEYKPLVVERGEIIPDAWMAELYRIAIIEYATETRPECIVEKIKELTNSYYGLRKIIHTYSATKFYDYILGREDGWRDYAEHITKFSIVYMVNDVAAAETYTMSGILAEAFDIIQEKDDSKTAELKELIEQICDDYEDWFIDCICNGNEEDCEEYTRILNSHYIAYGYSPKYGIQHGFFICDLIDMAERYAVEMIEAIRED